MPKLEEVSRNTLLGITKSEPDLRVKARREQDPNGPHSNREQRSAGYKGFSVKNIDTTNVLSGNSLVVQLGVGNYDDIVELEDILYWIQISAEQTNSQVKNQINSKVVTQALMNSIDGMDINLDCSCADWQYRFAYQATILGYKYGEKEGRPNEDIRANPENRGGVCKHLYAVLSNKRWLQQVTSIFMDWIEQNIDKVNKYLGLKGDKVLTVPDTELRQLGKSGAEQRKANDEARRKEVINNYFDEYLDDNKDTIIDSTDQENIQAFNQWVKTTLKRFNLSEEEQNELLQQLLDYKSQNARNVKGNNPSTNAYNNIDNQENDVIHNDETPNE